MRRERLLLLLSLAANILLLVALFYGFGHLTRAKSDTAKERQQHEQLRQRVSELESAAKVAVTNKPALTDTEVLELARLRNEVTRLRNEQRAAPSKSGVAPVRPAALSNTEAPQAAAPAITTLTATVSANVGLGQALAVGGWAAPSPGRRIVGLLTPELHADSPGSVMVTTRLMELPDAALEQLGLQGLRTDQQSSLSQGLLTAEQLKALVERAEKMDGVDVLTTPRVLTLSGRQAQVSVTQAQPNGTHTGPVINLTPTLDATGTSVRLDVGLELNLPATKP